MTRLWRSRDAWAIGLLIAWPFVFFWQVTLGQGVWFTRDVSRVYHPFAVELSRALSEGHLPLWTPLLQAGFPLFAEGQVAALYPIHLFLVKLLAPEIAISIETVLHLAWASFGMYALVRGMRFGIPSALLAGIAFSFSGFMIQKVYHMPILWTAAWMPWLVLLFDRFQCARRDRRRSAGVWFLLTTLAMGAQWFSGSAQIALLNSIVVACVGFVGGVTWNSSSTIWRARLKEIPHSIFWVILPLILGVGIGAIQLLPTAELVSYSVRAGGLDQRLLTLYSYSADSFKQFVSPFSQGEPSDDNVELWGYVGITTLIGAAVAVAFRRDAKTIFFAVFAVAALSLTLGDANPVFRLIAQLPILNLFRVPARYVLLFGFATAILAATTLEALTRRTVNFDSNRLAIGITLLAAISALAIVVLAYRESLQFWFSVWNWLPWLLALLVVVLIWLAWTRRIDRAAFSVAMVGLVLIDLSAYAAPFLSTTVAELTPPAYVNQAPRSVPALDDISDQSRIFTDESIWPSVPALRSSFYPNYGLNYGRESAHIYSPLAFEGNENYFFNLSPVMLNLLNVRLFSVPLEPRSADRAPTPYASLALDVVGKEAEFAPTSATAIQIDSFTEDASNLLKGSVAADVRVSLEDGLALTIPLRVGIETADWDWAQKNAPNALPQSMQVAHPVSAFVRSLGHPFEGYVYRTQFKLDPSGQSHHVMAIGVLPVGVSPARLSIERISLIDGSGQAVSVAALIRKDDFALKYMSDTAAIWENLNVMPRAFLVHRAEVMDQPAVFERMHQSDFRADQTVLLNEGQSMTQTANVVSAREDVEIAQYQPEYVRLNVTAQTPGYLVLADSWYPGWNAFVDGKPTPVYQADYIFRAIPIQPGQHTVVFEYQPMSLIVGAGISVASLVIVAAVAFAIWHNSRAREGSQIVA